MNDNFFDVPAGFELPQINTSNGVVLPFPSVQLSWWNGDKRFAKADKASVQGFGGWYAGDEYFSPYVQEVQNSPRIFTPCEMQPRDGEQFNAWQSRFVPVLPIMRRAEWFQRDNGSPYSVVDYLCLMGEWQQEQKQYTPFGAVVLRIKGTLSSDLDNAFKKFASATSKARAEFAGNAPANRFYCMIGTFGEFAGREAKSSKNNSSSTVTPPVVKLPEPTAINAEFLRACFAGKAAIEQAVEYYRAAEMCGWAEDLKNSKKRGEGENGESRKPQQQQSRGEVRLSEDMPF